MSMLSNSLITGGVFKQIVDQRQVYTQKSAMDYFKEAVAYSAFHNSGERFNPPKCHPNTRVTVLDKIEKWALRTDPETREASILWLSGAAGAGKSAIAQTLAERFHAKGHLIASFFFGRSDLTRNHTRSLVATIAYQLYSLLPMTGKNHLLGVVEHDPLVFTKSLLMQFESLIMNPLHQAFESGSWDSISSPRLVVIDGLDECLDRQEQFNVLLMLSESVRRSRAPLLFLLASRAEHDIQATFSSPEFLFIHTRLYLDNTYLPDNDIRLFLHDQFEACRTTHPFKESIPPGWPSDEIVTKFTRKSSGQFIYASVVAKYIMSSRHRPHHRLDVVLNLRPVSRDLPFSELDALYTHIFSTVDEQDIRTVLRILSFDIFSQNKASIEDIEYILRLDPGDVQVLLCDLASIIGYHQPYINGPYLQILHASLSDYLLDRVRSEQYYIDTSSHCAGHAVDCLQYLSSAFAAILSVSKLFIDLSLYKPPDSQFGRHTRHTIHNAMYFFIAHYHSMDLTESLRDALKTFSIPRCRSALDSAPAPENYSNHYLFTFDFLPALFNYLKKSDDPHSVRLLKQHQSEYDLFLQEGLREYPHKTPLSLILALISVHRDIPRGAFNHSLRLFDGRDFVQLDSQKLRLCSTRHYDWGYMQYLSDFLGDSTRSREFAAPMVFAQASIFCLNYLCDHQSFEQKIPSQMSLQQRLRRLYTPWKWHRRVLRDDIRGWRVTPWLWLRRPKRLIDPPQTRVLHRKANDLIYIHAPYLSIPPEGLDDPVVMHRVNSEKYYLALIYLILFLPRAAKLDDLVHMCQRLTFASLSQYFPRKSVHARSCMQKYIAQWE